MREHGEQVKAVKAVTQTQAPGINEVKLSGRVSADPEEKVLPSGDVLWQVRVIVPRAQPVGRQTVDVVDCVAWTARARRSVSSWKHGDEVEVAGCLRRRFFRGAGRTESRTEVEVSSGRRLRKAPQPAPLAAAG